jgi:hypothetical protein
MARELENQAGVDDLEFCVVSSLIFSLMIDESAQG